jgi:hypothetical protein
MILKSAVAFGLLLLFLAPIRAEDFLKEALEENSPLVKTSSDHRVKVTLLYIGPMKEKLLDYTFVITYLVEDCTSDAEFQRNQQGTTTTEGHGPVSPYALFPAAAEVKDGSHQVVGHPGGNYLQYKNALLPDFKANYPKVTLPAVEHPDRARIYQCFYKSVLTGPFDITLHDYIPAYGQNSFHFRDVNVSSFTSN